MAEQQSYKDYPILFVDDEELALQTLQTLFENDFTVYTAPGAEAALEIIEAHPEIAMVVSDHRMPKMTGVELLTEVFERRPKIITMLLTAYSNPTLIKEVREIGNGCRYMTKPYDAKALRHVLVQGIEQYRKELE